MASKFNGIAETEWARAPPTGPCWRRCLKNIYDPGEKSFLGRTAKRWGIVVVFYGVFYAVLALLFALCMGGLFLTLDPTKPKYTLDKSLIGANPGVSFRPFPSYGFTVQYSKANTTVMDTLTKQLDTFMEPYQSDSWIILQHECIGNDSYGLPDTPCFFVKLNRIFDWKPVYYDDVADLPAEMPEDLVEHINSIVDPLLRKKVWVSCSEEHGNSTKIEYPWGRGLPESFFPFRSEPGYRSPLVAVRLAPPVNTLVIIRCRAWAKNIIYNKSIKEGTGYARIMLYIEDTTSVNNEADTN